MVTSEFAVSDSSHANCRASSGDAEVLVSAQTAYKESRILRDQEVGSTIQSPLVAEGRPYSLYS